MNMVTPTLYHHFCYFAEQMKQPCLGLNPLIDEQTNMEYTCGENTKHDECPSFSYCHRGDTFSKCCPFPPQDGKIVKTSS